MILNRPGILRAGFGKMSSRQSIAAAGDIPTGGQLEIAEEGPLGPYLPRDFAAGAGGADWIVAGGTPTWADEGDGTGKITCDGLVAQDLARWHPPNLSAESAYTFVMHITAIAGHTVDVCRIDPGASTPSLRTGTTNGPGYFLLYDSDWGSSAITVQCLVGDELTVDFDYFEVFPGDTRATWLALGATDLTP